MQDFIREGQSGEESHEASMVNLPRTEPRNAPTEIPKSQSFAYGETIPKTQILINTKNESLEYGESTPKTPLRLKPAKLGILLSRDSDLLIDTSQLQASNSSIKSDRNSGIATQEQRGFAFKKMDSTDINTPHPATTPDLLQFIQNNSVESIPVHDSDSQDTFESSLHPDSALNSNRESEVHRKPSRTNLSLSSRKSSFADEEPRTTRFNARNSFLLQVKKRESRKIWEDSSWLPSFMALQLDSTKSMPLDEAHGIVPQDSMALHHGLSQEGSKPTSKDTSWSSSSAGYALTDSDKSMSIDETRIPARDSFALRPTNRAPSEKESSWLPPSTGCQMTDSDKSLPIEEAYLKPRVSLALPTITKELSQGSFTQESQKSSSAVEENSEKRKSSSLKVDIDPGKLTTNYGKSDKGASGSLERLPPTPQDVSGDIPTVAENQDGLSELKSFGDGLEIPTFVIRRPSNMTDPEINCPPKEDPLQVLEESEKQKPGKYSRITPSPMQTLLSRRRSASLIDKIRTKMVPSDDESSVGSASRSPTASRVDGPAFFSENENYQYSRKLSLQNEDIDTAVAKKKKKESSFYHKLKKKKDIEPKEVKLIHVKPILKPPTTVFKEIPDIQLVEYKKPPKTRKRNYSIKSPPSVSHTELNIKPFVANEIPDPVFSKARFDETVVDIHFELKKKNPSLYQKIKSFFDKNVE